MTDEFLDRIEAVCNDNLGDYPRIPKSTLRRWAAWSRQQLSPKPTLDAEEFVLRVMREAAKISSMKVSHETAQLYHETREKLANELRPHLHPSTDRERAAAAWRPISEAPKDRTWVVLFSPEGGVQCGYWGPTYFNSDHEWIQYSHRSDYQGIEGEPTHYMPLPAPPTEAEKGAGGK